MSYNIPVPVNFELTISAGGWGRLYYRGDHVVSFYLCRKRNTSAKSYDGWHIDNFFARWKVRRMIQKALTAYYKPKDSLDQMIMNDSLEWGDDH